MVVAISMVVYTSPVGLLVGWIMLLTGTYYQGARMALEMVEGKDFELDFIRCTPLIPFMQHL